MAGEKVPNRTNAKDEPSLLDHRRKHKFGKVGYDPKYATMAFELLSNTDEAKTKAHVCAMLQISKPTMLDWMRKNPDFNQAVTEGLRLGEAKWREKIREHAFEPSGTVNNGLIKLLSANVYGIKEEPQIVINNQQGDQNAIINDEMSAKEAAQAYSDMLKANGD